MKVTACLQLNHAGLAYPQRVFDAAPYLESLSDTELKEVIDSAEHGSNTAAVIGICAREEQVEGVPEVYELAEAMTKANIPFYGISITFNRDELLAWTAHANRILS